MKRELATVQPCRNCQQPTMKLLRWEQQTLIYQCQTCQATCLRLYHESEYVETKWYNQQNERL